MREGGKGIGPVKLLLLLIYLPPPLLSITPHTHSAAIPRRSSFTPTVDLLSLGLGCEWSEPLVLEEEANDDVDYDVIMKNKDREPSLGSVMRGKGGGAAIRISVRTRSVK